MQANKFDIFFTYAKIQEYQKNARLVEYHICLGRGTFSIASYKRLIHGSLPWVKGER